MSVQQRRLLLLILVVVLASLLRVAPHPPNFSPVMAIALFGGAYFADRRLAYLVPLSAMLLSDSLIGFHGQMWLVYGCFALVVWLGTRIAGNTSFPHVLGATLAGSLIFFLVTNLGVWAFDGLYPRTWEGLVTCYVAALPFFQNSLLGNVFYVTLLFGGWHLAQRRFPSLSEGRRLSVA